MHGPEQPAGDEPAEADGDDGHDAEPESGLDEQPVERVGADLLVDAAEEVFEEEVAPAAGTRPLDGDLARPAERFHRHAEAFGNGLELRVAAGRGEVAGDEGEVRGEEQGAGEQEEPAVPERKPQPDAGGGPAHAGEQRAHQMR